MTMNRSLNHYFLLCGLFILFFFSCKKDKEETVTPAVSGVSIIGKAEKGPFKKGSDVVIYELNSNLEQTGKSYATTVSDNAGNFSFHDISLSTNYASITVTGYYNIEHFIANSPYRIYLEALADAGNESTINVNLLTHLIKPRIEKLVSDGSTFSSARTQAQNELKSFLHCPSSDSTNFEDMSLANNPFLFAASLLFQRRTINYVSTYNYSSELSNLLNKFRNDFKNNGQIDGQDIIDTLIYNANRIELIDTKTKFETFMTSLGITTSLNGYEQYIFAFQKAYSTIYPNYVYPNITNYERDFIANTTNLNLLNDTSVTFLATNYNMSAIVPFDSSLIIRFTLLSPSQYSFAYSNYGWVLTTYSDGFSIEAQRKNYPNARMIYLWESGGADSARIEYFKNHEPVASFSKIIHW